MGTLNNRCRSIIGTQKGTIILTTTHVLRKKVAKQGTRQTSSHHQGSRLQFAVFMVTNGSSFVQPLLDIEAGNQEKELQWRLQARFTIRVQALGLKAKAQPLSYLKDP